jgi:predicted Ser/Thr protein kinase
MPPPDYNEDERLSRAGEILDSLCSGKSTLAEATDAIRRARDEDDLNLSELTAAVEQKLATGELPELAATALLSEADNKPAAMTRLRPAAKVPDPLATRHVAAPTGRTDGGATDAGSWADSATVPARLGVGDILRERFVIDSVIGEGGMGVVFRARDRRREEALDRNPYVAIKFLGDQLKSHPDALIALQREARRMQQLSHPHIASVYDFDRDGAHVYLVMELLEGDSLDRVLERNPGVGLPSDQARRLIEQAGRALRHAHSRGVVHSDFKPANVFLTHQGDVKIIDFGIARIAKDSTQGAESAMTVFDAGRLGAYTNAYASPEQILGTDDPHPKDDIYSFGLVVYEALTGRHPFGSKSAVEARFSELKVEPVPGLSAQQNALLASALAFDRKLRLDSVSQLIQAFALNDDPIIPMREALRPRSGGVGADTVPAASPERRRNMAVMLLAAVVVAGILFYAARHRNSQEQQATTPVPAEAAPPVRVDEATSTAQTAAGDATQDSTALPGTAPGTSPKPGNAVVTPAAALAARPASPKIADGTTPAGDASPQARPRKSAQSEAKPATSAEKNGAGAGTAESAGEGAAAPPSDAAEGSLYRWVDKQGNVQFGAKPPAEYADVAVKVVDF